MLMRLRMPTRWAPPRRLRRTAGCTLMGLSGKAVDVAVGAGAHVMTIVRLGGRWSRLWLTAGLRLGGKLLRVRGQVTTLPGDAEYCGATKHSDNSGELTGLLQAVLEEEARVSGVVEFCVDSTYAINVATGKPMES